MAKAILTINRIVPLLFWSRILPFRLGSSFLIGGSLCLGRVSFVSDRMRLNENEFIIPGSPPLYIENQKSCAKSHIPSKHLFGTDVGHRLQSTIQIVPVQKLKVPDLIGTSNPSQDLVTKPTACPQELNDSSTTWPNLMARH